MWLQVLKIWADRDLLDSFHLEAASAEAVKRHAALVRRFLCTTGSSSMPLCTQLGLNCMCSSPVSRLLALGTCSTGSHVVRFAADVTWAEQVQAAAEAAARQAQQAQAAKLAVEQRQAAKLRVEEAKKGADDKYGSAGLGRSAASLSLVHRCHLLCRFQQMASTSACHVLPLAAGPASQPQMV